MPSHLIGFEHPHLTDYPPDFFEKIGNVGLGLLRIGFGKSVRVTAVDRQKNSLSFEEKVYATSTRIASIALLIFTLPISLLLIAVGVAASNLSNSYKGLLKLYHANSTTSVTANPTQPTQTPDLLAPDLSSRVHDLRALVFGNFQPAEVTYESTLEEYYKDFSDSFFASIHQTRKQALANQTKQLQIAIVGAGPAGLIAAYEAYIHGAKVALIEQRAHYLRDQILRLSPDTYDYLKNLLGPALSTILETEDLIVKKSQGEGDRHLFTDEIFYTIETRDLEKALSTMLKVLSSKDPTGLTFYRNHQFVNIQTPCDKNPNWRAHIKDIAGAEQILSMDIIIGADGSKSTVREMTKMNFSRCSSTYTYGAATFDFPSQYHTNATELDVGIPQLVSDGAALSNWPHKEDQLRLMKKFRRRTNVNTELDIIANRIAKKDLATYLRRCPTQIESEAELDFVKQGAQAHVHYLRENFGWQLDRLPISRFFTSSRTVYIGCEFPEKLLQELPLLPADTADRKQQAWFKAILKAHLPDEITHSLRFKHSNIFPLALSKTTSPYTRLMSSDKPLDVLLLGDSFVTPHFLTGSGAQHAIGMSRQFGDLLSKMGQIPNDLPSLVESFVTTMQRSAEQLHTKAFNAQLLTPQQI